MFDPSNKHLSFHQFNIMELVENFKSIEFLVIHTPCSSRSALPPRLHSRSARPPLCRPNRTYPKEGILWFSCLFYSVALFGDCFFSRHTSFLTLILRISKFYKAHNSNEISPFFLPFDMTRINKTYNFANPECSSVFTIHIKTLQHFQASLIYYCLDACIF